MDNAEESIQTQLQTDTRVEEYLFRKIAENYAYIRDKHIKPITLCHTWSDDLRKMGFNCTSAWVRQWVTKTLQMLSQGMLPEIAQNEDLSPLAFGLLNNALPWKFPTVNNTNDEVQLGPHIIAELAKSKHYCEEEQEIVLMKMAQSNEEITSVSRNLKSKFYSALSQELANKGYSRTPRSLQRWIANLRVDRLPIILFQPNMSNIRDSIIKILIEIKKSFVSVSNGNLFAEIAGKFPVFEETVPESKDESADNIDSSSLNLRKLLEKECLKSEIPENVQNSSSESIQNLPSSDIENDEKRIVNKYDSCKQELQFARKRRRTAEREIDELKEKLRIAGAKFTNEEKRVRLLEDQLEELKKCIQNF